MPLSVLECRAAENWTQTQRRNRVHLLKSLLSFPALRAMEDAADQHMIRHDAVEDNVPAMHELVRASLVEAAHARVSAIKPNT